VSQKADEERKRRPNYRPIIEHDGLPRQRSSYQVLINIISFAYVSRNLNLNLFVFFFFGGGGGVGWVCTKWFLSVDVFPPLLKIYFGVTHLWKLTLCLVGRKGKEWKEMGKGRGFFPLFG
jgi:hypothetical protein